MTKGNTNKKKTQRKETLHRKLKIDSATWTTLKISGELSMENAIIGKSKLIDEKIIVWKQKSPKEIFSRVGRKIICLFQTSKLVHVS
jgi:hypothetical protein